MTINPADKADRDGRHAEGLALVCELWNAIGPLPVSSDPYDAITLLIATSRQTGLNKRAWVEGGLATKKPPVFRPTYVAITIPVASHDALERVLMAVGDVRWATLMPGIARGAELLEPYLIRSSVDGIGKLAGWHTVEGSKLRAIARIKTNFTASNWVVFDRDKLPEDLKHLLNPSAWWGAMGEAIPALEVVRVTGVPSTTGRIVYAYNGHAAFDAPEGLHAWIRVRGGPRHGDELVAFKRRVQGHLCLAGAGRRVITEKNGHRFEGLIDPTNLSTERPCFDGARDVGPGLQLLPQRLIRLNGNGGSLDASAIPDLTEAEERQLHKVRIRSAHEAAKRANAKTIAIRVDRTGYVEIGRGKRWERLLNGLGVGDHCRDLLVVAFGHAGRAGVTAAEMIAEIDRRLADPPALLKANPVVMAKLRSYRDDPDELVRIAEWAEETRRAVEEMLRRPAWLASGETRAPIAVPGFRLGEGAARAYLLLAEMGMGKSEYALGLVATRIRGRWGPGIAPVRDGGRKRGAVYWAVPTIDLAEEMAARAREVNGLRPYVLRGRRQPVPGEAGRTMCAKSDILPIAETAHLGDEALCGKATGERCSAWGGCPWIAQADEIAASRANIVFMTHASLFSTPPGGARLPHPVGLVVDEEPVLGSGLAVERRVMGKLHGLGLGADEIAAVRQTVETHAISRRRDIIEILEDLIEETEAEQQTAWRDLGSREDRARRARTARIWIESGLERRALREAERTADALRRMEAWIRSQTAPGPLTGTPIVDWLRGHAAESIGVLWEVTRQLKVAGPATWTRTPEMVAAAVEAASVRLLIDFFRHIAWPVLDDGVEEEDETEIARARRFQEMLERPVPAADVEIVAAEREDGSRARVPVLRFAYLRRLLGRWRDVPTLLLNGTGDPEIYRRVWPETEVSSYHAMPWAGRVFWAPDAGFGKSRMVGPDGQLTARGEEVSVLFRFLDRYAPGGGALVTHMAAEKQIAKVAGEGASTGHHGAVLGLDSWRGKGALVVAGRSLPQIKSAERAAEALFGVPVERVAAAEGKTSPDFVREPVVVAGMTATIPSHADPRVTRYMDQVACAGQAQAAARTRAARDATDVFVLGAELPWTTSQAPVVGVEWAEIRPDPVIRMLAERGVAFSGRHASKTFAWLSRDGADGIARRITDGHWLIDWAAKKGVEVVTGRARANNAPPKTKSAAFVGLVRSGESVEALLAAAGLERAGGRTGVRQRRHKTRVGL